MNAQYIKTLVGYKGHTAMYDMSPPLWDKHRICIVEAGTKKVEEVDIPTTVLYAENGEILVEIIGTTDHGGLLEDLGYAIRRRSTR